MALTSASTRTRGLVTAPLAMLALVGSVMSQLPAAHAEETSPNSLVNGSFTHGRLGWAAGSAASQLSIIRQDGDRVAALGARPGATKASLRSRSTVLRSSAAGQRVIATAWVRSSGARQRGALTVQESTATGRTLSTPQPFTARPGWRQVSVSTTSAAGATFDVLVTASPLHAGQRLLVDRVSLTALAPATVAAPTTVAAKISDGADNKTVATAGVFAAATSSVATAVDLVGSAITPATLSSLGWVSKEEGRVGAITSLPSADGLGDSTGVTGTIMRSEVRPGETYTGGDGHTAPRSEVYGRIPKDHTLPASAWADPPGSERWYDFEVFIPNGFPVATDTKWFTFTQWKGLNGGSPPIALELKRSNLRLGGTRTNAGLVAGDGSLGPIAFGQWTRLTVGIKFSTDPTQGWVQVYRDGLPALARTPMATMDTINGNPDPTYLKQGIYRSAAWTVTQALYFSPMNVTDTQPAGLS